MRGLKTAIAVVLTVLGCGGSGGEATYARPTINATRLSLANGLDIVLAPNPACRTVSVSVRYDVGSRHDPEGGSGLAHLVEHLMFRTKLDGDRDAFALLEGAAPGLSKAETLHDSTSYYDRLPAEDLPTGLFVEAVRMARPLDGVDEAVFAAEQDMVRNERRESIDELASANLEVVARELLFAGTPYARPIAGSSDDLARLTLADAKRFTSTYYRPNNATLVILGGFDPHRAIALVHAFFDAIPAAPLPTDGGVIPGLRASVRRIAPSAAEAPTVTVAWSVPAAGRPGWPEMLVVAELLDQELRRRLVNVAARVVVHLEPGNVASVLFVGIRLARPSSADVGIEALDAVLDDLGDARIPSERVSRETERLSAKLTLAVESLEPRAVAIQSLLRRYDRVDGLRIELNHLASVRREGVARVVDSHLRKRGRVIVEARPGSAGARDGRSSARLFE